MKKEKNILFSIIIATYNRAHIIGKAIESIINQTYNNWELIIVDDGSTDNTKEIVESYSDNRISYFLKKNEERSIARNYGIDKSKGDYISFLDDDDYYLAEFLYVFNNKIASIGETASVLMCFEYHEKDSIKVKNIMSGNLLKPPLRLLWTSQTSIRPFVFQRDVFRSERFKEECKFGQDFHLAIRIALKYKIHIIPDYLSVNVMHQGQGTNLKFLKNYRENAELSIMCINNLLENHFAQLVRVIPKNELFDLVNHKIYGFASAALKHCDFNYFNSLFWKLNLKASIGKTFYYGFSLILRFPYYYLKCIYQNNK